MKKSITEVAYVACESLSRHLFKVHLFELAFEWIQAFRNALRIDNCDDNRKISYKQNKAKQVNGIFVIVVDTVAIVEYERGILMVNKTME